MRAEPGGLTDLHCHLLPGIDDGSKSLETTCQLFRFEYNSGVRQIALTSHFNCENQSLDDFLERRRNSWEQVKEAMSGDEFFANDLRVKLGAEVYYSPNLREVNVRELCIEGTNVLLLELPVDRMPLYLKETLYHIQAYGITLMIAHIERYAYIMKDLPVLCDWIDQGIYTQINAASLLRKDREAKLCLNLLKWNLAHVVSSDAHSLHHRPPNLAEGMGYVSQRLGEDTKERLTQNACNLFDGIMPEIQAMHCPRRFLGGWR